MSSVKAEARSGYRTESPESSMKIEEKIMRMKALSTAFATITLALGLAVSPASFAHGTGSAGAVQSTQQTTQAAGSQQNQTKPDTASDAHSGWWNNQSTSSSNCAKSFSQLGQCSV